MGIKPEGMGVRQTMADDVSDYIFFASYVQPAPEKGEAIWSNTDAMEEMNGTF